MDSSSKLRKSRTTRTQMGSLKIADKDYPIYSGLNTIGRSLSSTVLIKNANISQHHAILTVVDETKHFVSDYDSCNGTYMNGNKLQSLCLYELSNDMSIQFGNIQAIYNTECIKHINQTAVRKCENTQIMNETFHGAATQILATSLEDDGNDIDEIMANLPITTQNDISCLNDTGINMNNTTKKQAHSDSCIHNLATQSTATSSSKSINEHLQPAIEQTDQNIHDLPTQTVAIEFKLKFSKESESLMAEKSMNKNNSQDASIHDVPTQKYTSSMLCSKTLEHAKPDSQKDINIHEAPTQKYANNSLSTTSLKNETTDSQKGSSVHDAPTQKYTSNVLLTNLMSSSDVSILDMTPHRNRYEMSDSEDELNSDKIPNKSNMENVIDETVINNTHKIDFSTIEDSNESIDMLTMKTTTQKATSSVKHLSPESDKSSQIPVIYRRSRNPLDSGDSDVAEENSDSGSDIVRHKTKKHCKKPLHESTPSEDSDSEMKLKKKNIIYSDHDSSGSETDMEADFEIPSVVKGTLKCNTTNKDDNSVKKTQENVDGIKEKSQNSFLTRLNDSDVIPATQEDENDDYDFNFEINLNKPNCVVVTDDIKNKICDDVVEKPEDLPNTEESTEDSFRLHLSDAMDFTCINPHTTSVFVNKCDIFSKATQKLTLTDNTGKSGVTEIVEDLDATQIELNDEQFIEAAEEFSKSKKNVSSAENINNENKTHNITDSNESFSKSRQQMSPIENDSNGDIFLMATQKINVDNNESYPKSKHTSSLGNNNEDIFLRPTQKLNKSVDYNSDSNVFLKSTQKTKSYIIGSNNDEDIFLMPTQKIDCATSPNCNDLFLEPTQKIVLSNFSPNNVNIDTNSECAIVEDDSFFNQPTQKINENTEFVKVCEPKKNNQSDVTSIPSKTKEDIFNEPTQIISCDAFVNDEHDNELTTMNKQNADDIFMQPTQKLSLLPISEHVTKQKSKIDDVESQLEVMFATQTLKVNSDIDSRPSNPLAVVLDNKESTKTQHQSSPNNVYEVPENINNEEKIDSQSNSDSSALNDYCLCPTLPIDEDFPITDLQHKVYPTTTAKSKQSKITPECDSGNQKPIRATRSTDKSKAKFGSDQNISIDTKKNQRSKQTTNEIIVQTSKNDAIFINKSNTLVDNSFKKENKTNLNEEKSRQLRKSPETKKVPAEGTLKNMQKTKITLKSGDVNEDIGDKIINQTRTTRSMKTNVSKNTAHVSAIAVDATSAHAKQLSRQKKLQCIRDKKTLIDNNQPTTFKEDIVETVDSVNKIPVVVLSHISVLNTKRCNKLHCIDTSDDDAPTSKKQKVIAEQSVTVHQNEEKSKLTRFSTRNTASTNKASHGNITEIEDNQEDLIIPVSNETKLINTRKQNLVGSSSTNVTKCKNDVEESADLKIMTIKTRRNSRLTEEPIKKKLKSNELDDKTNEQETFSKKVVASRATRKSKKQLCNEDSELSIRDTPPKRKRNIDISDSDDNQSTTSSNTSYLNKTKSQLSVTLNTPERNRRKQKPKVVFTMFDSPELESAIRSLGGVVVDNVDTCTVLVTGALKRSQKLLTAIGQGKPVCSPVWLQESKKSNTFLDPWDFIYKDKEAEKKWNFTLLESLRRSQDKKLFEGYNIQLFVNNAADVLKGAIESCGGKCVTKMPPKNQENTFLVVASPENKTKYSKYLKHKPPVTVVAPEAIFDGVLRQELHFELHQLK